MDRRAQAAARGARSVPRRRRHARGRGPRAGTPGVSQGPGLARSDPRARRDRAEAPHMMPVLFVAHGAPPLLDDPGWIAELGAWAAALPRPSSILMISAHWEQKPLAIGATRPVPLIYDFYGFPEDRKSTRLN